MELAVSLFEEIAHEDEASVFLSRWPKQWLA